MSHTPGPWTLICDEDGALEIVWKKTTCICDFGLGVPKMEDARLITAAPELLNIVLHLRDAMRCEKSENMLLYLINRGISPKKIDAFLEKIEPGKEA